MERIESGEKRNRKEINNFKNIGLKKGIDKLLNMIFKIKEKTPLNLNRLKNIDKVIEELEQESENEEE